MGNGYIFVDPSPETVQSETFMVPEFPSSIMLLILMIATIAARANRLNCQWDEIFELSYYALTHHVSVEPTLQFVT